ncbi:MAG: glycoside hydrolase family 88 protein [Clostridiales bacterium]|nr:glycoside hydrolase family 88 protein [Clostridiales bacterium]
MKRKFLAAAMAAIMVLGSLAVVSAADTESTEENVVYDEEFGEIELKEYSLRDEDVDFPAKTYSNQKGIDLAAGTEASWRGCLSTFQQSIYDGICSKISSDNIAYDSGYSDYVLSVSTTVSGSFDSYNASTSGYLDDSSELTDIGWAILRDYPEYYWLKSYTLAAGIGYSSKSDITYVQFIFYSVGSPSEVAEYIELMDGIEADVVTACSSLSTKYEKVLYIHNLICNSADYATDVSNEYNSSGTISDPLAFSPLGIFYEGKAVCQGYALAFGLLCGNVGVDTVYQSGTAGGVNHAWNWVLMNDGLWYGVDSTWDGQTSSTVTTYFLLGTTNFNKRHTYTNSFGITISADDYVFTGDEEEDPEDETEREKKMRLLIKNMTADGDPTDGSSWNNESPNSFKWSYINGAMISALLLYGDVTADTSYETFADTYMSPFINSNGSINGSFRTSNYALDDINSGKALIELISRGSSNSTKYKSAVTSKIYTGILQYMLANKTTAEGSLWHKNVYPYQVWLDGIYMETPFYLQYELEISKDADAFKEAADSAVIQIENVYNKLKDEKTGLYYHGYDAQADSSSGNYDTSSAMSWALNTTGNNEGASSSFWLRGMGWYAMGLVDDIELLQEGQEEFGIDLSSELYSIVTIYTECMESILNYRSDSGLWYQVMDKPDGEYNYTETSGSAALSYALMKGANLGVIPESYYDEGYAVFEALLDEKLLYTDSTETDVVLNDICGTAGLAGPSSNKTSDSATRAYAHTSRDGSYEYYVSEKTVTDDAKGAAPLIMAYSQVLLRESGDYAEYTPVSAPYTLGDVNDDGIINFTDATRILLYYAKRIDLGETALKAADVNGDGIINSTDATRILLYYAKRISSL